MNHAASDVENRAYQPDGQDNQSDDVQNMHSNLPRQRGSSLQVQQLYDKTHANTKSVLASAFGEL
jgi:hypothetical protein